MFDVCDMFKLDAHCSRVLGRLCGAKSAFLKGGKKLVLLRYGGRGGNRGKLVSVIERESK